MVRTGFMRSRKLFLNLKALIRMSFFAQYVNYVSNIVIICNLSIKFHKLSSKQR